MQEVAAYLVTAHTPIVALWLDSSPDDGRQARFRPVARAPRHRQCRPAETRAGHFRATPPVATESRYRFH